MLQYRTFKLGKLYFKYLANTPHEHAWPLKKFAAALADSGLIRIVEVAGYSKGHWVEKVTRYIELQKITQNKVENILSTGRKNA